MKNLVYLILFISISINSASYGQKARKKETITIQTSAECGQCKTRIESKLNYTKGILFAELDLETKKATVKYKTKKIDAEKIKKLIATIGYDADEVKAKKEDVEKLPKCCQPEGINKQ